jgi:hypothetical protein
MAQSIEDYERLGFRDEVREKVFFSNPTTAQSVKGYHRSLTWCTRQMESELPKETAFGRCWSQSLASNASLIAAHSPSSEPE